MDQKQMANKMIEFNKTTFDNTFSAIVVLQDQTEKLLASFLDKATWFPEDGKKAVTDWVNSYKKSRDEFKATVDESFRKVSSSFTPPKEEPPEKGPARSC